METSAQVLASLASFIFYASLKTTVLVALILLAQKVFGRFLAANGRYLLWLTGALPVLGLVAIAKLLADAESLKYSMP